jgi:hypothetical protein
MISATSIPVSCGRVKTNVFMDVFYRLLTLGVYGRTGITRVAMACFAMRALAAGSLPQCRKLCASAIDG